MFVRTLGFVAATGLMTGLSNAANALPVAVPDLIAHRAVYDLELKDASDRSGIEGMTGRMVYEFTGSACQGYKTDFRFVTQINTGDAVRMTDQQTTTFEDMAAKKFTFETKSYTDDKLDKEVQGAATDSTDGVKVDLTRPDARQVSLVASEFPTEHMFQVIEHAKQGKRIFESRIFDGSDDGDESLITSTLVGKSQMPKDGDAEAGKVGEFAKAAFWPVTIAYYNDKTGTDALPIYRMSFKLYENGITRDLTMDYGDFVLTGKLAKLDILKPETCENKPVR
ncbi:MULTISPECIES: cell envelope integrity EipB family protein [unclassified Agrobacterium]|uniref:cell envelope integrity EipB family protein n=1 Tax=unclassified Agrobacterium TaxID=2632611 RepID=UPI00244919B8|nr:MULTISPECIES: cell envelope integrity EipB family protein [unclassified Agrobacterium]MDH0614240.1 cell envelope integrity EipB family protein [Agrobacterium sp. GD03872]MDH0695465.1 cell envelope integrity EipB family protein [Agrobacterium sp. GD03871]MDH1058367.1 cell envelope integrity EipB family protein [Agrobacterium sp. GD03992]MDH2209691.1 cell envelope integrity EipB family protein [Agrobacterium sp. GD03643]MDH2219095.1 cell envelope integrity EipB family protein [Agrobacterium s